MRPPYVVARRRRLLVLLVTQDSSFLWTYGQELSAYRRVVLVVRAPSTGSSYQAGIIAL
jgi:hypothetical protein